MRGLCRLVLVRHGETVGRSSIRFYGRTDVALSELGFEQASRARRAIPGDGFEIVASSPLMRAWQTAGRVAPGRAIRLEGDFREIDFGRWEGLTRQEIAECDPDLYRAWQDRVPSFEFPEGETRAGFHGRVTHGLQRLQHTGARSMLVVAHKGVVRTLVEFLTTASLEPDQPSLGGVISLTRSVNGTWIMRSRNHP